MNTFTCFVIYTLILSVLFAASGVRADVYRCVLGDGHVSYQQIPCHSEDTPLHLIDKRSGWSPLRPAEQTLLNNYRKQDAKRHRKTAGTRKASAKETRSCWNKRQQLETVRSKMRRGYKLKESDELHRKRRIYEDYLRQFCS